MTRPQTSGAQYCFTKSIVACRTACISDLSPLKTSATAYLVPQQDGGINPPLPVHFAQNDVECSNDGYYIRHQMSARHLVKRLQIHKGGRTDAHAIGLHGSVADDVITQFAFGRFNRMVDFARRRLQNFADFARIGPAGMFSMACRQISRDWRISSMRTR